MPHLFVRASAPRREPATTQGGSPTAAGPTGPATDENRWPTLLGTADSTPAPEAAPPIGSVLYLSSLGLVAAGVIAVFFGTGLSLLAHSAGGRTFGAAETAPAAVLQLPAPGGDRTEIPPRSAAAVHGFSVWHEPSDGGLASENDSAHQPARAGTSTPDPQSADKALLSPPQGAPPESAGGTASAPARVANSANTRELLEHGDALLRTGDVVSARLFYEHAANAGDGRAALRLGATFDPGFLGRIGATLQADAALARTWYSRALDLGAVDAKGQLNRLDVTQGSTRR